ncbi:MAG: BNR-4 repeat-containing protein, partial [Lentisphaeria bacterium]|nr:BNR-4 repeat-containing protein [Lentisphaeria bacterium]
MRSRVRFMKTTNTWSKPKGYRGIWSSNGSLTTDEPHAFVHYSGGFATAFCKHLPMAMYAETAEKTFFCYAGSHPDEHSILIMASYFDHRSKLVPRPTVIIDKCTDDAHDNPVLSIDGDGFIWIFASAHGTQRPAYIFRSQEPYSTAAFDPVDEMNFS